MFDILAVESRHLQSLRDQSLLTLLLSNPQVLIRLLRLEDRITVLITGTVANPPHIRKLGIVITTNFRNISVTCSSFQESVGSFHFMRVKTTSKERFPSDPATVDNPPDLLPHDRQCSPLGPQQELHRVSARPADLPGGLPAASLVHSRPPRLRCC